MNNEEGLENMNGLQRSARLMKDPALADKCDWSKLDGWGWAELLTEQPQLADKCDWSKLDGWDWSELLMEQPQLADKCDWKKWTAVIWHGYYASSPVCRQV